MYVCIFEFVLDCGCILSLFGSARIPTGQKPAIYFIYVNFGNNIISEFISTSNVLSGGRAGGEWVGGGCGGGVDFYKGKIHKAKTNL